jgi:putative oxidoreductase
MSTPPARRTGTASSLARCATGLFGLIPYWLIALSCRVALAKVFWSSAETHLANWQTTLYLFANSYPVPLLPPAFAAHLAVALELVAPPLLLAGLATRFVALALFGMTLVIEIFVYPGAWPTHIQWASMMLVLMAMGAGSLSLDALIRGRIAPARPRAPEPGSSSSSQGS